MGDQRLAVINGRLYAPRDTLSAGKPVANKSANNKPAPDKAAAAPYQVVDVLPYKVLLACDGQILELGYSNVTTGSAPAKGNGKAAGAKSWRRFFRKIQPIEQDGEVSECLAPSN